jgi:hypothetical protein
MRSRFSLLFLLVLWLELFAIVGSFAAGLSAPEIKIANAQIRGDLSNAAVEGMISWIPPQLLQQMPSPITKSLF